MRDLDSLALRVQNNKLHVLNQQKLPIEVQWIYTKSPKQLDEIIKVLMIRGAPLLGVAAVLFLALYAENGASNEELINASKLLKHSRPTAVNLATAIDRLIPNDKQETLRTSRLVRIAEDIFDQDVELCNQMASNGLPLVDKADAILTHCNTGGLATVGIGTALGVLRRAHEQGLNIHVYVDETRPLLQGARLNTWELDKLGVPHTLICDNMAATLMQSGVIQKVFVGADRIAINGDFANKIGTYGVAVLAKQHGVPFYCVAPHTTIDSNCSSGQQVPIEQRHAEEVRGFGDCRWVSEKCKVYNPAFDVTPIEFTTGIVTDRAYYSREEIERGALEVIT